MEACRVGFKKDNKAIRPVKVTVSSAMIVNQILSKARNLKEVQELKMVFMCPDRSLEQRKVQRLLVADLKKKKKEEPDKRFFIKGRTPSASKLLELIANNPNVSNARFEAPVRIDRNQERFSLSLELNKQLLLPRVNEMNEKQIEGAPLSE